MFTRVEADIVNAGNAEVRQSCETTGLQVFIKVGLTSSGFVLNFAASNRKLWLGLRTDGQLDDFTIVDPDQQ